jgi:hypothetical protein
MAAVAALLLTALVTSVIAVAPKVIIHIILLAVFVFLGNQLEELDQTKAQRRRP